MQDKEFPKRKNLRLKDFDYSSNNCYFVTICTKGNKSLLSSIVGDAAHSVPLQPTDSLDGAGSAPKKIILKPYGKIAEKHILRINSLYENIRVEKYIIMPNHIHMLVFIDRFIGSNETDLNKAKDNNGTLWLRLRQDPFVRLADISPGRGITASKEENENNGTMWASSPTTDLSTVVRTFKTMVTKEIGTAIWQRSFYDEIIKDEKHFQNVWDYIAFNALKEYSVREGEAT